MHLQPSKEPENYKATLIFGQPTLRGKTFPYVIMAVVEHPLRRYTFILKVTRPTATPANIALYVLGCHSRSHCTKNKLENYHSKTLTKSNILLNIYRKTQLNVNDLHYFGLAIFIFILVRFSYKTLRRQKLDPFIDLMIYFTGLITRCTEDPFA